jgi:branched-chain amino acid transport system ATP-binding protein
MLDEPSLGLAPVVVEDVFATIRRLNEDERLTVLLVEQQVAQSLVLAHRGYVLENGRIVMSGGADALLADDGVRRAYIGL